MCVVSVDVCWCHCICQHCCYCGGWGERWFGSLFIDVIVAAVIVVIYLFLSMLFFLFLPFLVAFIPANAVLDFVIIVDIFL